MKPHHYMNADGYCHAGDMFEAGTEFIALYTAEDVEAAIRERVARLAEDEALVERVATSSGIMSGSRDAEPEDVAIIFTALAAALAPAPERARGGGSTTT